jgi:hypothetical protein
MLFLLLMYNTFKLIIYNKNISNQNLIYNFDGVFLSIFLKLTIIKRLSIKMDDILV